MRISHSSKAEAARLGARAARIIFTIPSTMATVECTVQWTRPAVAAKQTRCELRPAGHHVSCDDDVQRPTGKTHPTWQCGGGTCLRDGSTICLVGDSLTRQTFIEMACDESSWGTAVHHTFRLRNKSMGYKVYLEPSSSLLGSSIRLAYIPQATIPSFNHTFGSADRHVKSLFRSNCSVVVIGWGAWHVAHVPLTPAAYRAGLHAAVLGLRRALAPDVRILLRPTLAQATTMDYSFTQSAVLHHQLHTQHGAVAGRCEHAERQRTKENTNPLGRLSGEESLLAGLTWASPSQLKIRAFNEKLDQVAQALGVQVVGGRAAVLYNLTAARPCLHVRRAYLNASRSGNSSDFMPLDPTHWCTWQTAPNPAVLAISTLLRRMMPPCA